MRKPQKKSNNKGGKEKVLIEAFTESVERVGADTAFHGLVCILALISLPFSANGLAVFGIVLAILAMWNISKIVNAHIEEKKARLNLEKLKVMRGVSLLDKYKKVVEQIEPSDKKEV